MFDKHPTMQVTLDQGVTAYVKPDDVFVVVRNCYEEGDLHNFKPVFRTVMMGTEITAKIIWYNHIGIFIRCEINGDIYDLKPSNLRLKDHGNESN